jgi:hypothetical protein
MAVQTRDTPLEVLQAAAVATGNGTVIDVRGIDVLAVDITGTFVGTVTFEGSLDSTTGSDGNFFAVGLKTMADGAAVTSATAAGAFKLPVDAGALAYFRARVSAWTSGTITVKTRKSYD